MSAPVVSIVFIAEIAHLTCRVDVARYWEILMTWQGLWGMAAMESGHDDLPT
jgi:hypothetical protein